MPIETVAVMSPGDMGEGVGDAIRRLGKDVITMLAGRSADTRRRAERSAFRDVPDLATLMREADLVLSIMPPERAEPFAAEAAAAMGDAGRAPPYADMNAISPMTSRRIAALMAAAGAPYIDGGIVGTAPYKGKTATRLYVSGPDAGLMDDLASDGIAIRNVGDEIGRASAIKMIYASITKGTDSLLTAAYTAAESLGVREELEAEWRDSQPDALDRMARRVPALPADAGRWIGEMEEIAATYAAAGVTPNFHRGAADIYRLLAATPFAAETRETRDRSRTMQETVRVYVAHLPDREAAE